MSALIPGVKSSVAGQLLRAWGDTFVVLAGRWRMLRTKAARAWAWAGLLVGLGAWVGAARLGDTVRTMAASSDEAAGIFARNYIRDLHTHGAGSLAGWVSGFIVAMVLVGPLLGASVPQLGAAGLPWGRVRLARYTDSLVAHVMSIPIIMQLLALSALASIITVSGTGRGRALGVGLGAWVVLNLISVALSWAMAGIGVRRRGVWVWRTGAFMVIGASTWFATTPLFGRGVVAMFTTAPLALVWVGFVLGAGAIIYASVPIVGATLAASTLSAPVRTYRSSPLPTSPWGLVWVSAWRIITRTPVIFKPVLAVSALGAGAILIAGGDRFTAGGVNIMVLVILTLAWPVNALALFAGAGPYLATLPHLGRVLPRVLWALATIIGIGVLVVINSAAALIHHWDGAYFALTIAIIILTSAGMNASALGWSITHPHPVHLDTGAPITSPATTMGYFLRLVCTWGLGGLGVLVFIPAITDQPLPVAANLGLCAALGAAVVVRTWWGHRVWSHPVRRAQALST